MRVLFAALKFDYGIPSRGESLERAMFFPALQNTGHEIVPFWLEEQGFPEDPSGLQQRLVREARRIAPDVVFFVLMRDEVSVDTIRLLSSSYATLNWFSDDQWRFDSFTVRLLPALRYAVTVDKYSLAKYKAAGFSNVIRSQWGCCIDTIPAVADREFEYEVSFVGGWNLVREWYVDILKTAGVDVRCFGSGWREGRLNYEDAKRVIRNSMISLNLSNSQPADRAYMRYVRRRLCRSILGLEARSQGYWRSIRKALSGVHSLYLSPKRVESIKARNFEIPAWGGFQISQFALEIDEYFIAGREIVLFSRPEELVSVVRYYLVHSREREAIRAAGARRATEHTYDRRMLEVLKRVEYDLCNIPCF